MSSLLNKILQRREEQKRLRAAMADNRQKSIDNFNRKKRELRENNISNFGAGANPKTPGLDRQDYMQGASFGGNTALAGSVATGVGQDTKRTVSPESSKYGQEARGAAREGDLAGAAEARRKQEEARRNEPNIVSQEQRRRRDQIQRQADRRKRQEERVKNLDRKAAMAEAKKRIREAKKREEADKKD